MKKLTIQIKEKSISHFKSNLKHATKVVQPQDLKTILPGEIKAIEINASIDGQKAGFNIPLEKASFHKKKPGKKQWEIASVNDIDKSFQYGICLWKKQDVQHIKFMQQAFKTSDKEAKIDYINVIIFYDTGEVIKEIKEKEEEIEESILDKSILTQRSIESADSQLAEQIEFLTLNEQELKGDIVNFQAEIDSYKKVIEKLQAQVNVDKGRIVELNIQLAKLNDNILKLQQEKGSLQKQYMETSSASKTAQDQVTNLNLQIQTLKKEVESQKNTVQQEKALMQKEMAKTQKEIARLTQDTIKWKEEYQKLNEELVKKKSKLNQDIKIITQLATSTIEQVRKSIAAIPGSLILFNQPKNAVSISKINTDNQAEFCAELKKGLDGIVTADKTNYVDHSEVINNIIKTLLAKAKEVVSIEEKLYTSNPLHQELKSKIQISKEDQVNEKSIWCDGDNVIKGVHRLAGDWRFFAGWVKSKGLPHLCGGCLPHAQRAIYEAMYVEAFGNREEFVKNIRGFIAQLGKVAV